MFLVSFLTPCSETKCSHGRHGKHCVVPENIHTPTTEGIGNSERVGGGGQRPRKFQRGGRLDHRFCFQMPFDSIRSIYSTDQKKPNRERLTERVLFPFHTRSRSRSVSVPFPFCIRSLSVPYPFRSRSVSVQCCSVPALLAFDL